MQEKLTKTRWPNTAIARNILGVLLLMLAVGCGGGGDSGAAPPAPTVSTTATTTTTTLDFNSFKGSKTTTSIISAKVGATYPINIYTPSDYASTTDLLPVIYTLDGGDDNKPRFEDEVLIMERLGVRAILVGIGNFARRDVDYRMPGAIKYNDFLTMELIPFVEANYRADPQARTLTGHSYGGLFTLLALLMDPPDHRTFANFMSLDGSFWDQSEQTKEMEQTLFTNSGGKLPGATLVLSSATGGNNDSVQAAYDILLARKYQGLKLVRLPVYVATHVDMFDAAFADSLTTVFKK